MGFTNSQLSNLVIKQQFNLQIRQEVRKMSVITIAKRPRNAWSLAVTNVISVFQVDIFYKNTKGDIGPFKSPSSQKNAAVKIPFGPPTQCEYRMKKGVGGSVGEYKFSNKKGESCAFPETLLNNFEFEVNGFSKRVTKMVVEDKKELLALYLTALPHSENFIHHNEETHSSDGFSADDSGVQIVKLIAAGGSLEDYKEFIKSAKESAKVVESLEKGLQDISKFFVSKGKRKSQQNAETKAKMTKLAAIDEHQKKELEDENGLETQYQNNYVGMVKIPLANINVSEEMMNLIDENRVNTVVASIRNWYEPALNVFVVCPEEESDDLDLKNVEKERFLAVQKLHTLIAFKKLDEAGEFSQLKGHQNGAVLCYVLKTNKPELRLFGNMKSNEISSQFSRKTKPQALLHYFKSLSMKDSRINSMKVVERMASLARIGPDESTSLRKLCQWTSDGFLALMEVVEVYEMYGTMDVKPSGHKGRLARGEKLNMSNVLFKLLGMSSENYFVQNFKKVLNSEVSLKTLLDEFQDSMKVQKVCGVLSIVAGYKSYETIKEQNPGKFEYEQMKHFIGAEMKGEKKNTKAILLDDYFKSVKASDVEPQVPEQFVECSDISTILSSEDLYNKYDTIFVGMKVFNKELCTSIIGQILRSPKPAHAVLLVFPREANHYQVLTHLRSQSVAMLTTFQVIPLLFNKEVNSTENVIENISYAILFGKITILSPPLKVHYNSLSQLTSIVECISPLKSSVAVLCDQGVSCPKIYLKDSDRKVKYYAPKSELLKLRTKPGVPVPSLSTPSADSSANTSTLNSSPGTSNCIVNPSPDAVHATPARHIDFCSDNVDEYSFAEDSTSPIKCVPARLDDSGFMDVPSQVAGCSSISNYGMQMRLIEDKIDDI